MFWEAKRRGTICVLALFFFHANLLLFSISCTGHALQFLGHFEGFMRRLVNLHTCYFQWIISFWQLILACLHNFSFEAFLCVLCTALEISFLTCLILIHLLPDYFRLYLIYSFNIYVHINSGTSGLWKASYSWWWA